MSIQKYQDSFSDSASSSFSTMLDRFFSDSMAARGRVNSFSPHVDAYETEKSYEIEAALPGMKREDIKVDFHQGRLTITGERQFRNEKNERRYHLVESSYGSFNRSFQLPDTVDANGIEASFENGMLHIRVPKDQQKTMRHQIQVKGAESGSGGQKSNGSNSGQMSERVGQQATDVRVQSDDDNGQQNSQSTSDAMKDMQSRPQSSGVGA